MSTSAVGNASDPVHGVYHGRKLPQRCDKPRIKGPGSNNFRASPSAASPGRELVAGYGGYDNERTLPAST